MDRDSDIFGRGATTEEIDGRKRKQPTTASPRQIRSPVDADVMRHPPRRMDILALAIIAHLNAVVASGRVPAARQM